MVFKIHILFFLLWQTGKVKQSIDNLLLFLGFVSKNFDYYKNLGPGRVNTVQQVVEGGKS
jgi:hypothetical protein